MGLAQGVTHQEDFAAVVSPPFQPFDKFSHACVVPLGPKEVRSYVTVGLAVNTETSNLRVFNLEWRHDYCTESGDTAHELVRREIQFLGTRDREPFLRGRFPASEDLLLKIFECMAQRVRVGKHQH